MLSLIRASGNEPTLGDLRSRLLNLIGQYQDCLMACEHQYSKRTDQQLDTTAASISLKYLSNVYETSVVDDDDDDDEEDEEEEEEEEEEGPHHTCLESLVYHNPGMPQGVMFSIS
ncbi:hypothetical protein C0Q70_02774 [Pomacea canaliculata]|uniref:Uncharacterized protein n=1 Tax=Pomacea canaliculata TaxID=400727 RepID=A0A2T7PQW9_POMCA|nr:hypothetical protein C0Q70_02774 [Pomacea canaliculata]